MGQKIIPISLRLNKNKNWHSKWVVNKNEYSDLLHFDLEIRKYFTNVLNFKEIKLIKLNIIKISKNINIYIYIQDKDLKYKKFKFFNQLLNHLNFFYKNHSIKIFLKLIKIKNIKYLKKNMGQIFRYIKKKNKINFHTRQLIYNFAYGFYTKNIKMISCMIKQKLERKKTHKKIFKNINDILIAYFNTFSNFIGYRLQFKGRLNGYKRKKKIVYQKGKMPLNTLKYDIKYDFNEFKTPSGICSIKFWVFFKRKKKKKTFKKILIRNIFSKYKLNISKYNKFIFKKCLKKKKFYKHKPSYNTFKFKTSFSNLSSKFQIKNKKNVISKKNKI